jgi:hypothetical protein
MYQLSTANSLGESLLPLYDKKPNRCAVGFHQQKRPFQNRSQAGRETLNNVSPFPKGRRFSEKCDFQILTALSRVSAYPNLPQSVCGIV